MNSIQERLTTTKSFNTLFLRFMDDVLSFLPNDNDYKKEVKQARNYFDLLRSMNPALIIKVWYSNIYLPYQNEINSNDLVSFVLKKDYEQDLSLFGNVGEIIQVINHLKGPVSSMTEEQKIAIMEYLRKLSILSNRYADKGT